MSLGFLPHIRYVSCEHPPLECSFLFVCKISDQTVLSLSFQSELHSKEAERAGVFWNAVEGPRALESVDPHQLPRLSSHPWPVQNHSVLTGRPAPVL